VTFQVAIPSHRRARLLESATLATLARGGVDLGDVTVFLDRTDPDMDAYGALARRLGLRLVVSQVRGINPQRRLISGHYAPGVRVLCMDDDVTDVVRAIDTKHLEPIGRGLAQWITAAFDHTDAVGLKVWGTSAVANAYFMTPGRPPTEDLKFLIATMYGFVSRPGHPVHNTTVAVKEDYELSLRAWWYDGGVVRYGDVTTRADHYKAPGGCQDYRTADVSLQAAASLENDWPGIVRRNTRRKSGHAEILLNRRPRHGGRPPQADLPGIYRPSHGSASGAPAQDPV